MEVQLRAWRMEDAEALAVIINNPKILANLRDGIPYPYTVSDGKDYITSVLNAERDQQYNWAIMAEETLAGSIGILRKNNIHRFTAELGYFLGEPFWGRGLCTAAVKAACAYIFENTDIMRIFAEPFAYNTGSCRVLEKAGFHFEGLLRKNAVKNGQILDMKLYALVKEDAAV